MLPHQHVGVGRCTNSHVTVFVKHTRLLTPPHLPRTLVNICVHAHIGDNFIRNVRYHQPTQRAPQPRLLLLPLRTPTNGHRIYASRIYATICRTYRIKREMESGKASRRSKCIRICMVYMRCRSNANEIIQFGSHIIGSNMHCTVHIHRHARRLINANGYRTGWTVVKMRMDQRNTNVNLHRITSNLHRCGYSNSTTSCLKLIANC